MLDSPLEDWPIVKAILNDATEQRQKYDQGLAKYVAHTTANRTVSGVSKTLNSLMKALRNAQQG